MALTAPNREWRPGGIRCTGMAEITVFSTGWCGYCHRLRAALQRSGIGFAEVDIDSDPDGEELVTFVNGGFPTVPTVMFPDGSTLTNPSVAQIRQRLADLD